MPATSSRSRCEPRSCAHQVRYRAARAEGRVRTLRRDGENLVRGFRPVGYVEDESSTVGPSLLTYPYVGSIADLANSAMFEQTSIDTFCCLEFPAYRYTDAAVRVCAGRLADARWGRGHLIVRTPPAMAGMTVTLRTS